MGATPPVGPLPRYVHRREVQDASPRQRRCLLKQCEQSFRPAHRWARYCSSSCRQDARRWSQWFANRKYRASQRGKAQRRGQSQRNRQRRCQGPPPDATQPATCLPRLGGEGYQQEDFEKKSPCQRPGCYECFAISIRSPLKKFCSALCRKALRAVLQREARWRRRQRGEATRLVPDSARPP